MLEDCLSEGYFFWTDPSVEGREPQIVRCPPGTTGYRDIFLCLVELEVGTVIPVNFLKAGLSPKHPEGIRKDPGILHRNIVYSFEHMTLESDEEYKNAVSLDFGISNAPLLGIFKRQGDCFVKASIISSYYRTAGMPTRIVGFRDYPKEAWASICRDYKTYPIDTSTISEDLLDRLEEIDPEVTKILGEDKRLTTERLIKIRARHNAVPLDPKGPSKEFSHCWIETLHDGQVKRYNPNKEDNAFNKLMYERSVGYAKIFPELHVSEDFKPRWKDLSFESA